MSGLWEILIELIGKSEEDPLFIALACELGKPEITISGKRRRDFNFPLSGLSIGSYDKMIETVFFHYGSASVECGEYQPYAGNLANDVKFGDAPSTVAIKLGMQPSSVQHIQGRTPEDPEDLWQFFKFGNVDATFSFDGCTNVLDSISLNKPAPLALNNYAEVDQPHFFDHFSRSALLSLQCARAESRLLRQNLVGSEQLLLGMLLSSENLASQALKSYKVTPEKVRREIVKIVGKRNDDVGENIPFTPMARKILFDSRSKASYFESNVVEEHHILLSMLKDAEGVGPRILENLKVNWDSLEDSVLQLIEKHRK